MSSDITVRAKAAGPALAVPPPAASKPVIDEVLDSLAFGRAAPPGPATLRVFADATRVAGLFPAPPFLAFSPANVEARYDDWTFEILEGDRAVWRATGVGPARDDLSWDGRGGDGRLAAAAGLTYRYRFTGRRGAKAFVLESDPVPLRSFALREYLGEERLEVGMALLFARDRGTLAASADRYLLEIAARLRAADPRPDGSYRCELYAADPRAQLSRARAKALAEGLAEDLQTTLSSVRVEVLPADRGEAFAAFVPVSRGARLGKE